ncbi:hypothetical protein B0H17DRAFT_1140777 [Mycena rosella]|uniref:DEAD/DEAH-box helicase domain-containing protein n=1 Tax=Mycena rosella TaxID=1033263 RepID=A0AAD7D170_MYCRO|nr:hypothetical protein B0H17DRAFT_1140777 [Mycena rosella]
MSETFLWSSPEGYALVRRILEPTPVPYIPHDHQLEGICKSLDGVNLFAITPTGSGKSSYYIIYIIVVLAVVADPSLCPSAKFPANPCLLIICPTIPLQLEMAANMTKMDLDVLAINSETRNEAQRVRNEELWTVARMKPNVILSGPEQLKCSEFEKSLRDPDFFARICGTGFDERNIIRGFSVRDGAPFNNITKLLGLNGNYHLIHRSCSRSDIQILFRELVSPIGGEYFPEFNWVLTEKRPTVLYIKSISLGSRIYSYLLRRAKLSIDSKWIRMYNSLNFESYNAATREQKKLAPDDEDYCQIIVGTDTLSVGVAMLGRVDAILVREVADADELVQKFGRINRTKDTQDTRGIIYISAATRKAAEKLIVDHEAGIFKAGETPPDLSMTRLIVAPCKIAAINLIYNNPPFDPLCTCISCCENPPPPPSPSCNCSGCAPDKLPVAPLAPRPSKPPLPDIPKRDRLSRLQKAYGKKRLLELRLEIWRNAMALEPSKFWMHPPDFFLADFGITAILDNYSRLRDVEDVRRFVQPYQHLSAYSLRILKVLEEMKPQFAKIAADRKAENAANREKKKQEAEAEPETDVATDEVGDEQDGDIAIPETISPAEELRGKPSAQEPNNISEGKKQTDLCVFTPTARRVANTVPSSSRYNMRARTQK